MRVQNKVTSKLYHNNLIFFENCIMNIKNPHKIEFFEPHSDNLSAPGEMFELNLEMQSN